MTLEWKSSGDWSKPSECWQTRVNPEAPPGQPTAMFADKKLYVGYEGGGICAYSNEAGTERSEEPKNFHAFFRVVEPRAVSTSYEGQLMCVL